MNQYRTSGFPGRGAISFPPFRPLLLALACSLGVMTLSAQTDYITLGNYQVHPTRILAKFKEGTQSVLSPEAAKQIGSKVHRKYRLVPGLAVFEEANVLARAVVSANDEATLRTRLLSRIEAMKQSGLFEY